MPAFFKLTDKLTGNFCALLDLLDIKGCIVTIDAMGCQEEIAAKIIEKESDYILAVKDNQKNLHQEIIDFFECAKQHDFKGVTHDYFEEISKGHGRVETRKSWISTCLDTLANADKWSGLTAIGMVESERYIKGVTTIERRHYISSIAQDAEIFSHAVRSIGLLKVRRRRTRRKFMLNIN